MNRYPLHLPPPPDNGRSHGIIVALAVIYLGVLVGLMLSQSGCATGNKGVELNFEPQRKSTVAENIEAGGRVAAGAFDRLFNLEK